MTKTPTAKLFDSFRSSYSSKYQFYLDEPIGSGANAYVYKAKDIHRSVDVAIKIFINGQPPVGVERAWKITSKVIDPQIAPTFTIEEFSHDNAQYIAVVSRFIPGQTIKQIWTWLKSKSPEDQLLVGEDLAKTFVPSLLQVLENCHRLGYGHGDLHEGNMMTFLADKDVVFKFQAVLIDFDNASLKTDVHAATESEKQMADIRLFKARLGPYLTMDWKWGASITGIYQAYDSFKDLRVAYLALLEFINIVESGSITVELAQAILKPLVTYMLGGFQPKPTVDAMRNIATLSGNAGVFDQAYEQLLTSIRNPSSWSISVDITEVNGRKNTLYKELFDL